MSRPSGPAARRSVRSEYIETDTGNKISRRAFIEGKQNIMLGGKTVIMAGVHLRGDLFRAPERPAEGEKDKPRSAISIGRATVIATNTVLRPPMRIHQGQMIFVPMRIGDNVFVGPNCHISSASISSHVYIGASCVLSPLCMIKEGAKILPNTVVPSGMTVPPGTVVGGQPAKILGDVGDGWGQGGGVEGEEWVEGGDLRPLVRSIK